MKKQLLLSLSLVALVGLVDSASAMKRKNEDVPDEKNKKIKLISQEEFNNLTEEEQKEQIRREKQIVQDNRQIEFEDDVEDIIDAEELPNLSNLKITKTAKDLISEITKFLDTTDFSAWIQVCKIIKNEIYKYDENGNQIPLLFNNRPAYKVISTLEGAIRANSLYFIEWFLKSKQYSLVDEIILLAFEKRYFKAIQLFLNDERFMSLMSPDIAGILPLEVRIEDKKHLKMLLDSKFFMKVYIPTDRMNSIKYILSSNNVEIDKKIIDVFFTHAAFVAFLVENLDQFFIFMIINLESEGDTKPLALLLGNEHFMKIFKDNGHAGQLFQQVSLFAYSFALGALLDNAEFMKLVTRDDAKNAIASAADDEILEILTTHPRIKELLALNEEN